MNPKVQLIDYFVENEASIEEEMSKLAAQLCVKASKLPTVDEVEKYWKPRRSRDRIEITLINKNKVGIDVTVDTNKTDANDRYTQFLGAIKPEDEIKIILLIHKTIENNILTVYCFDQFCEAMLKKPLPQMLADFVDVYQSNDHICFEVLDREIAFQTGTIAFTSHPEVLQFPWVDRRLRLSQCGRTSVFRSSESYPFIPEDFAVKGKQEDNRLMERFQLVCTMMSMVYLAAESTIENEYLNLRFDQNGRFRYRLALDKIPLNKVFYDIYDYVFSEGNIVDRVMLARNAICLFLSDIKLDKLEKNVLDTIQRNYELYLTENVEKYIELTNSMAGFIRDSIKDVTECISQLFRNLKANLLAVLSFIFTVALTNAVSNQPLNNFFTRDITWILYIVFAGSLVYYAMSIAEVHYIKKRMCQQYREMVSHYEKVLTKAEINKITDENKLLQNAKKELNKGMIIWSFVWIGIILVAFITIDCVGEGPHIVEAIIRSLAVG